MGLDMYLERVFYVKNWDYMAADERTVISVLRAAKPIPGLNMENISSIVTQEAYWRKANAIHAWFVDNVADGVDDCRQVPVTIEQVTTLRDLCKQILDAPAKNRVMLAEKLLPTRGGFFFGSTDYDQYYFADLRLTVEQLDRVLSSGDAGPAIFYYRASW